jgi:hypothetical protein
LPWLPSRLHSVRPAPSFPPSSLSPSLLAPSMPCADSLINSRLCRRLVRTGRVRTGPSAHRILPQVSMQLPSGSVDALGGGRHRGEWGRVTWGRAGCVCAWLPLSFARLCVCIHGYDLCVFACLCSLGSGFCATLSVPLWIHVCVCVCVCVCVVVPPNLLDPFVLAGTPGAPGLCPCHVPAGAQRGGAVAGLPAPEDLGMGQPVCSERLSSVGGTQSPWMLNPAPASCQDRGSVGALGSAGGALLKPCSTVHPNLQQQQSGQRGDTGCPRSHS